jgi:LmbE family N-acetylglucosaminyl deacetylase
VPEVWLIGGPDPDHFVDITDVIDRKIEALLCHESQLSEPAKMAGLMRDWATAQGRRAGLPDGTMVESFRRLDTR